MTESELKSGLLETLEKYREILDKTQDAIDRTTVFADPATKNLVEKRFGEEDAFFRSEYSEARRRFLEVVRNAK